MSQWKLSDTFIDIASAKGDSPRREFERMIQECEAHRISVILTKSISRFGRDTVDTLTALNRMKASGVRVIFEEESIDTDDVDSNLLISVMESVAQSENESRSENIRMGLSFRAANGTSGLYKRKLYGYAKTETGELVIDRLRWFVIFSGGISVVTAYWVSLKSYLKQACLLLQARRSGASAP